MKLFLILIIFCSIAFLSFPQSQKSLTNLYNSYLKGLFYLEKGDYEAALSELNKAKVKDPKSTHIRLKIATVLIRLDRIDEALEVLNQAKKADPNNLDIPLALIFVYSYTQNDEALEKEYEEFLRKAHQIKPKDVGISEYLAQFYFYKKKPYEAIKIYENILKENINYVDAIFWLGYLYEEVGRRKDAIEVWEKGLQIDPSHALILNSLGYVYAEEGLKLNLAEEMIKRALGQEPENGAYLDSLGWVYFKKGNLKSAEEFLTKAINYTKDPDIYLHLGDLYIKLGDTNKAISYYKEGLANFPDYKQLQLKLNKYERQN